LRVDIAGKTVGMGLIFEGVGLVAAHGASDGYEEGGVAGGGEDLGVEFGMVAGNEVGLLPGLILMVIGVGDDSPLAAAVG
jgi:hypothetical protein